MAQSSVFPAPCLAMNSAILGQFLKEKKKIRIAYLAPLGQMDQYDNLPHNGRSVSELGKFVFD